MATSMAWAKAKMRGKSGYGEDINKKMNRLLYLLLLLHPREIAQEERQGAKFRTSMERRLSERHRESRSSLVSTTKTYICLANLSYLVNVFLKIKCRGESVKR